VIAYLLLKLSEKIRDCQGEARQKSESVQGEIGHDQHQSQTDDQIN